MRVCRLCDESKVLNDFYKDKLDKEGVSTRCKKCHQVIIIRVNRSKDGKLKKIYDKQCQSSLKRGHERPLYTKKEFVDKFINDLDYMRHYYSWVISNYSKDYAPSFDRKDDYKGYSFDNIQIMYWFENNNKGSLDVKEGRNNKHSKAVTGTNIKTGEKVSFHSINEAGRNGFCSSLVGLCAKNKRNKHNGFTWEYKH